MKPEPLHISVFVLLGVLIATLPSGIGAVLLSLFMTLIALGSFFFIGGKQLFKYFLAIFTIAMFLLIPMSPELFYSYLFGWVIVLMATITLYQYGGKRK